MSAWKTGRTMQPRPQQGTSLLVALQVLATDEGIYLGRVAYKDPATGQVRVWHEDKTMWEGGMADCQHFAAVLAAAVNDCVEWVVS